MLSFSGHPLRRISAGRGRYTVIALPLSRACGSVAYYRFAESMKKDRDIPKDIKASTLETLLRNGIRTLTHRGPDSNDLWMSNDLQVGLGHVRLSLIDLTDAGSQPMQNASGSLSLVANGELYGFETIRADLMARGYTFKSHSDSEVILGLFEDKGFHCFEQMRGEFAFCLHDSRNNIFMAARDRFGIKPLFYTVHDGVLYVASEVKALFAMGVPAVWNPEALFKGGHYLTRHSIFKGIHQIPPGHYITATPFGTISVVPYWDATYPDKRHTDPRSDEDMILQVRKKLFESVELRMNADVPVSVYLSGGLDSCAVMGMAAASTERKVDAFTIR